MPVNPDKSMAWTTPAQTARFQSAMEEQARQQLAKRLKELRQYKGWTADELAHQSGVSPRTVSRLETAGVENPRETTLVRLADAFQMDREALAGPRLTPEAMDQAARTQLDTIEGMLRILIRRLPDPAAEIERELQEAVRQAAERAASNARDARSQHRRRKAP